MKAHKRITATFLVITGMIVPAVALHAHTGVMLARDLTGDWVWVSEYQGGQSEGTMRITRQDTTYIGKGTQPTPNGDVELSLTSARVNGDSVWVTVSAMEGRTTVTGAFSSDSTIAGTWSNTMDQSGPFRMRRVHPVR